MSMLHHVLSENASPRPVWTRCELCEDFVCTLHEGLHVSDCPCMHVEWWAERELWPYEDDAIKVVKYLKEHDEDIEVGMRSYVAVTLGGDEKRTPIANLRSRMSGAFVDPTDQLEEFLTGLGLSGTDLKAAMEHLSRQWGEMVNVHGTFIQVRYVESDEHEQRRES